MVSCGRNGQEVAFLAQLIPWLKEAFVFDVYSLFSILEIASCIFGAFIRECPSVLMRFSRQQSGQAILKRLCQISTTIIDSICSKADDQSDRGVLSSSEHPGYIV